MMVRFASFNVENLFADRERSIRPPGFKANPALRHETWIVVLLTAM